MLMYQLSEKNYKVVCSYEAVLGYIFYHVKVLKPIGNSKWSITCQTKSKTFAVLIGSDLEFAVFVMIQ